MKSPPAPDQSSTHRHALPISRRTFVCVLATATAWLGIPVAHASGPRANRNLPPSRGTSPASEHSPVFNEADDWADPGWM